MVKNSSAVITQWQGFHHPRPGNEGRVDGA
jgi:hypothetical protein